MDQVLTYKNLIYLLNLQVCEGQALKQGKSSYYQVQYLDPLREIFITEWFSVDNIASTSSKQMTKIWMKLKYKERKNEHRKKCYIPMEQASLFTQVHLQRSWGVIFNSVGDGNCQFSAVCFFLERIGVYRLPKTLRRAIINYLRENVFTLDETPLAHFTGEKWERYLGRMEQDQTYGDHITLQAAADIFNVEFIVDSTLGLDARQVISPRSAFSLETFSLGHYAEGHGEHYVCINTFQ